VIQANAARLDRALWSSSVTVTARFLDHAGDEKLFNLEGTLLFQKPRNLRVDLRPGLGDQVMQIGSNPDAYWVWVEADLNMMRWGRHEFVGRSCTDTVAVRPDRLASALGLGGLPDDAAGLIGPARKFGKTYDILYYLRATPAGTYEIDREYFVERVPPYQIRLVIFRDENGRRSMSAFLDDYRPTWQGGPVASHAVNIEWPQDEGRFTMQIGAMQGKTAEQVAARAFERPTRDRLPPGMEIRQLDEDCEPVEAGSHEPEPTTERATRQIDGSAAAEDE